MASTRRSAADDGGGGDAPMPFVALDAFWNLTFAIVSGAVLIFTIHDRPSTPLRVWISGYALQCLLHVCFAYFSYGIGPSWPRRHLRLLKRLEALNVISSPFWWMLGLYWIVKGGQALMHDSPHLYWLAVVFLAFDVFFMIFCFGMACAVFFIIFIFIPIVAIIYALATKRGASEDDIKILPIYRFREAKQLKVGNNDIKQSVEAAVQLGNNCPGELVLHPDNSDCCICLSQYVEGVQLCTLPCKHHFHSGCISRWLQIMATCPLCKSSIRKGDSMV